MMVAADNDDNHSPKVLLTVFLIAALEFSNTSVAELTLNHRYNAVFLSYSSLPTPPESFGPLLDIVELSDPL